MSAIEKIKRFFSNIFSSKKALPETSNVSNELETQQNNSFNNSISSLVNSNNVDTETLIAQIKSREFDLASKSIEEIKDIQDKLNKYLSNIKNENNKLEETVTLYKQKLSTVSN